MMGESKSIVIPLHHVMAGLVPAIHALKPLPLVLPLEVVDARDKPGHDGWRVSAIKPEPVYSFFSAFFLRPSAGFLWGFSGRWGPQIRLK